MQIDPLTPTHLKRYNNSIFAIKELIAAQHVDGYEFMVDTLMLAFYGIEEIIDQLEMKEREDRIRNHHQKQ